MSGPKCVDPRTRLVNDAQFLIRHLIDDLGAQRNAASTGRAAIHTSNLDASLTGDIASAQTQDTLEIGDSKDLKSRLEMQLSDHSLAQIDAWTSGHDSNIVMVDDDLGVVEGRQNMSFLESFILNPADPEAAALKGVCVTVMLEDNGFGGKTPVVAVAKEGFDEAKEQAWRRFLVNTIADQQRSLSARGRGGPVSKQAELAMKKAGLAKGRQQRTAAQTEVTSWTRPATSSDAKPKTFKVGE